MNAEDWKWRNELDKKYIENLYSEDFIYTKDKLTNKETIELKITKFRDLPEDFEIEISTN